MTYRSTFNSSESLALSSTGAWGLFAGGDNGLQTITFTATSATLLGSDRVTDCRINGQPASAGNCQCANAVFAGGDETIAYASFGWGGLHVLDIRDPTQPALLGALPTADPPYIRLFASNDPTVVFATGDALQWIDVSDAHAPRRIGTTGSFLDGGYPALALSPDSSIAFVAGYSPTPVRVFDVQDATRPREVSSYSQRIDGRQFQVTGFAVSPDGRLGYAADQSHGLLIFELPRRP